MYAIVAIKSAMQLPVPTPFTLEASLPFTSMLEDPLTEEPLTTPFVFKISLQEYPVPGNKTDEDK
jgi:hypothetical protein